jgi:hypothetical protein
VTVVPLAECQNWVHTSEGHHPECWNCFDNHCG